MVNIARTLIPLHKNLHEAFKSRADPQVITANFLKLHGILHSKVVAPEVPWSYEDDLLNDLDEKNALAASPKTGSIQWYGWMAPQPH